MIEKFIIMRKYGIKAIVNNFCNKGKLLSAETDVDTRIIEEVH
jgi:hypothetical protein